MKKRTLICCLSVLVVIVIIIFISMILTNKKSEVKNIESNSIEETSNVVDSNSNIVSNPNTDITSNSNTNVVSNSNTTKSNSNTTKSNVTSNKPSNSNSNKTSNSNSNKTSNSNVNITYVKTITVTETKAENYKYGTKLIHTYKNTYDVYSDNSKVFKSSVEDKSKLKIDYSGYNAKPKDLVNEAKTNISVTKSYIDKVIEYVNEYRKKAGVSALSYDENLCIYANVKVLDMYYGNYFKHESKKGEPFGYIYKSIGILSYAENILMGLYDPKAVTDAWYNSEGHRKNMLNSSYTKIGVGLKDGYWVQEFR